MKLEDIKNQLNEMYKGKELSTSNSYVGETAYSIGCYAREILSEANVNVNCINLHDDRNIDCKVSYNNHTLFILSIKKSRGARHYRFGSEWYDWTIKSIDVEPYFFAEDKELVDVLTEIDALVDRDNAIKNKKEQQAIEVIKYIMDTFNLKDYDALYMCDYIYKNKYSLMDKLRISKMY